MITRIRNGQKAHKVSIKATPPIRGDIFDSEKNLVAANASLYEFVLYKNLNKNYF